MNQEVKKKWLAALRSGEYKQGNGCLRNTLPDGSHEHCCLGVLCELHSKETDKQWSYGGCYDNNCYYLGSDVRAWAGLTEENPTVRCNGRDMRLGVLNDVHNFGFEEIADLIEKEL